MQVRLANRFLVAFVFAVLAGSLAAPATAQDCTVMPEVIVPLKAPSIGAYSVWDGVHGEQKIDERFISGFTMENGHTFVVGEREHAKGVQLTLAEIDRRGRVVWEKAHEMKGLSRVVKVLPYQGKAAVLAAASRKSWIGFFDLQGELQSKSMLRGEASPHDIITRKDGGFMLAADAQIFHLNSKGQVVSKRAYHSGAKNAVLAITVLDKGYLASGYTENAGGRRAGWALKLNAQGGIDWQREYPRGSGAILHEAQNYIQGFSVVAGETYPVAQEDPKAAWVMVINNLNGAMAWQRYFTGGVAYSARDVMVSKQGLVSVLMDGEGARDYVRLVTMNPRGVMFDSQSFFNGDGADAYQMIEGSARERVIIGESHVPYMIEGQDLTKHSHEGWIVAAPSMGTYDDPCRVKAARQPGVELR